MSQPIEAFKNSFKIPELKQRIIFTLVMLAVYRLGSHVPVPGVNGHALAEMIGSVRVVNAGSVGMPFGEPGADWLLLGPGVELRHTPYDLVAAAGRIRATDYPQASEFAQGHVLHPPSEAEMVNVFERSAVR